MLLGVNCKTGWQWRRYFVKPSGHGGQSCPTRFAPRPRAAVTLQLPRAAGDAASLRQGGRCAGRDRGGFRFRVAPRIWRLGCRPAATSLTSSGSRWKAFFKIRGDGWCQAARSPCSASDRFVDIDVGHVGGAIKRHELTIGRGIEALYNDRQGCTVTYVPPSST